MIAVTMVVVKISVAIISFYFGWMFGTKLGNFIKHYGTRRKNRSV